MTTTRVDPDQVAALGAGLIELSRALADQAPDAQADRWALGCRSASAALDEAVSQWRHERLALASVLDRLGSGAALAGGAYADTETGVGRSLLGGQQ